MAESIRIAILDAVQREYWHHDEGITDGEKFRDLLNAQNAGLDVDVFYATEQQFPGDIDDYDGYLVSGSPASVHDEYDWIGRLSDWIVDAEQRNKRIVASCFGHQLVAKTYGGEVGKNESGWMIGNYRLEITRRFDWMQPGVESCGIYHFNQERVTRLPDAAVSFADSELYPDFAYTLGDNILCVQGHPEQPLRAMNNFLASMSRLPDDVAQLARERIDRAVPDADLWGGWMVRFLTR